MIKRITFLIITTFFLTQCGFTPLYLNQSNFSISEIEFKGDRRLNNYLNINLSKYQKIDQAKKFQLNIDTENNKIIFLKNKSAKVTEYELTANSIIKISLNNKFVKEIEISEKKNMNSLDDKFEEQKYERTIKQNFATSIVDRLILELSIINDN